MLVTNITKLCLCLVHIDTITISLHSDNTFYGGMLILIWTKYINIYFFIGG